MGNSSKEYMRAYRKANREKLNTQLKEWRSTRMEKVRADNRAWYEANKENRRLSYRASNKAWAEANKDKLNAKHAKRRAAKLNRTPSWLTKEDLGKIKELYKEAQKLREETGEEWHVDHIIPLQGENISGLHVPDNLQVIKATENTSKGNRYELY